MIFLNQIFNLQETSTPKQFLVSLFLFFVAILSEFCLQIVCLAQ